ncbi:MAG: class I SAM-dependent methyltransferase [Alphaproteobacteria bacterium]|jgi:ubiquinone/menaquinone biosynthesis C-methylase UbiE|nr:class I SAM-dependent methyltransferase [Alphaproteobacteria bacterium]
MSKYENYSEVAKHYDNTRVPLGAEVLLGALLRLDRPLGEARLLDAGCGTGAYSALAVDLVGHVDAMDINPGMLEVARAKLADETTAGRIHWHQGSIDRMPFEDGHFDAVMFNQVLHHLESGEDHHFDGHRRALGEAHRVLRPGGLVVVNCTTHAQLRDGYWYMHLLPTALDTLYRRCISGPQLEAVLSNLGFDLSGRFVPLDDVFQGPSYFDAEAPLDPAWRRGESSWSLAPDSELRAALARLRDLRSSGGLEVYFAEQDAKRSEVGQTTYFLARKA